MRFAIITLIMTCLLMIGCDMHNQGYHVVYKPKAPTTYTVVESPYESVVVVEEVYVCDHPSYDPTPGFPYECVDYGLTIGTCCSYAYTEGHWLCEEEWCWWEDMCYWENTYSTCTLY